MPTFVLGSEGNGRSSRRPPTEKSAAGELRWKRSREPDPVEQRKRSQYLEERRRYDERERHDSDSDQDRRRPPLKDDHDAEMRRMVSSENRSGRQSNRSFLKAYGAEKERDEAISHRGEGGDPRPRSTRSYRREEDTNSRRQDDRRKFELFRRDNRQEERPNNCIFCLDSKRCQDIRRGTFISSNEKVYIASQTARDSIMPFHSLICPVDHVSNGCAIDDDTREDIRTYKKMYRLFVKDLKSRALTDCGYCEGPYKAVFVEWHIPQRNQTEQWQQSAMRAMGRGPHYTIDAIPMSAADFEAAMLTFAQEFKTMENDLERTNKGFRKVDPKIALSKLMRAENPPPYIYVDFGLEDAYLQTLEGASLEGNLREKVDRRFIRSIIKGILPQSVRIPEDFDFVRYLQSYKEKFKPFDIYQS